MGGIEEIEHAADHRQQREGPHAAGTRLAASAVEILEGKPEEEGKAQ